MHWVFQEEKKKSFGKEYLKDLHIVSLIIIYLATIWLKNAASILISSDPRVFHKRCLERANFWVREERFHQHEILQSQ